jgi:predicted patatin/cPLA2 family phospholipase
MKVEGAKNFIKRLIPGKKKERWGLVLEGGAMRCVFTAGVLDAIHDTCLKKFDFMISVSAGTGCGISYLADQKGRSQKIFLNYLSTKQFIDFRRFLKGNHIMDLGYAIREINETLLPIDMQKFIASKTEFITVLTDAETGEAVYVKPTPEELMEALIASCNLPYLTRSPVTFRGREYVDGGVATPIPLQKGLEMGATKLVVVLTRPRGFRKEKSNFLRRVVGNFFNEFNSLHELIENDYTSYNRDKSFVENFQSDQVELICVEPPEDFSVQRLTTKREPLLEGYAMGVIEGMKLSDKIRDL